MRERSREPVHFWSTKPSYDSHLRAVYEALPPARRGEWIAADDRPPEAECCVVGAYRDVERSHARKPVLIEHGVGQTYIDNEHHPAYSSASREGVALYLVPNHRIRNRGPHRQEVVGSPRLDPWHVTRQLPRRRRAKPTVAVSFHWPCQVSLESGTAWHTYSGVIEELVARHDGVNWLGHSHPLFRDTLEPWWQSMGVEFEPDFDQVLNTADAYVCDNSSTTYEFASAVGPVVVLNEPYWRREVEHGLRFWEFADVGPQVDQPHELLGAILSALHETPAQRRRRSRISDELFAFRDGRSSARAAASILELLECATIPDWRPSGLAL